MSHEIETPGRRGLAQILPCTAWLRQLDGPTLSRDALAGLFVAILLVPQAIAYAFLADLPPRVGLITAAVAPTIYALLGTSRYLSIGPVALVSLLTADAIARATESTGLAPTQVALTLTLIVGVLLVTMGLLRLGQVTDFVSQPVLDGFTAAAALLIIASQLRHLLGVDAERGSSLWQSVTSVASALPEANRPTVVIGLAFLVLLPTLRLGVAWLAARVGLPKDYRQPARQTVGLLLLVSVILLTWRLGMTARGVEVVGDLGSLRPQFGLPPLGFETLRTLLPSAATIALVILMVAQAIAKGLAGRRRQKIDANQESVALGVANAAVSFVGGYPAGGSLSRSALTSEAGGQTPATSGFAAILVVVAAVLAAPVFAYLPKAALAAMIIVAVWSFLDVASARRTWRFSRFDGGVLVATFLTVLAYGPDAGLAVGVIVALAAHLWQTGRPRIVVEGQVDGARHYRSDERDDVRAKDDEVLVLRVDRSLFFGNVRYIQQTFLEALAKREDVRFLVLDMTGVGEVDATALELLESMHEELSEAGVRLMLVAVKRPLAERLATVGFLDQVGHESMFDTVDDAVRCCEASNEGA